MFSKSCQNILFSKVYATLLFRKESLSPIRGYGQEAILHLISGWYKFTKITSEPNLIAHREFFIITPGYYSIYANEVELYNKLLYIKENIEMDVIASTNYILTEKERIQYSILIELLASLSETINNKIKSNQKVHG